MNMPRVSKRGSLHSETMTSDSVNLLNRFAAELASTLSLRHGQGPPGRPACARQASRRSRARPCDLPLCRRGSLRIIAAITQESVITCILRHLKLASVPPPIAPARLRQEIFVFDEAHASVGP
jgi:hypothetical protein